jgi:hypothetical protein
MALRAWEYRQRAHAKGVWFRLRRVLAEARLAYAIPRAVAEQLVAEGHRVEPVGAELQPPKIIVFVDSERLASLPSRRELVVRLDAELLGTECLALRRFD